MEKPVQAADPPKGIEKLSTELLIEIFSFLSPQDRLSCALVCQRFYSVARYKKFHGALEIKSVSAKMTILKVFKGRIFPFWKLDFGSNVSYLWQKDWQDFWKLVKPHITEIDLSSCDFRTIQNVLPVLPRLEKLTLLEQMIQLPNSSVDRVALKSLRELDLSWAMSNAVLVYLVNCCPALELLNVRMYTFEQGSGAEIFKTLRNLYWVPKIKFDDFDAVLFKEQFSELNSLSNVEFAGMVIKNAGIGNHLGLFAAFQNRLDYIKFHGCSPSLMKEQLFEFLVGMEYVDSAEVFECNVNLNSTFNLFSQVKGLTSLELVNMKFDASETSKYVFAELEYLKLTVNDTTIENQSALQKLRLVCPKLRSLEVPKFDLGFADAFPLLEKLIICDCDMHQISLSDFCVLRGLERLTHLIIYNLDKLESIDWEFFVFKALKSFEIIDGSLKINVQNLHVLVERNPTINKISIETSNLEGITEGTLKFAFEPIWSVTWIGETNYYNESFKLTRKT